MQELRDGAVVRSFLYGSSRTPIAELTAAGTVRSEFVSVTGDVAPNYVVQGAATYYLLHDQLGSVRRMIDVSTGIVAQAADYDVNGVVTRDTSRGLQPFGYAGGLNDADGRTVHFGARDYDARTGRWVQPDPIGAMGGANRLAYARNDPVNHTDPSGLDVTCFYSQSTGRLVCTDNSTGATVVDKVGYAGKGDSKNDPAAQSKKNFGPLPQGSYEIIVPMYNNPHTGKKTLNLEPAPGNDMFGRDLFRIHGDNKTGTASEGCIVVPPDVRDTINRLGGGTLQVTP